MVVKESLYCSMKVLQMFKVNFYLYLSSMTDVIFLLGNEDLQNKLMKLNIPLTVC